jgi:hypothetical protein
MDGDEKGKQSTGVRNNNNKKWLLLGRTISF